MSIPATGPVGGGAVDGTSTLNQTNLSISNQSITNWPPGAALWLGWQMTDSSGNAQGLGIDNLNFSANIAPPAPPIPLNIQISGTDLFLTWPTTEGQTYQLEYTDDLTDPTWTPMGNPLTGTVGIMTSTNNFSGASQLFFRLQVISN